MIPLVCSFPTPPEAKYWCSVYGARREIGMTHIFQRTYSSCGTPGKVNFIIFQPSLSQDVHFDTDVSTSDQTIHIFSDASEKAYGSVAYIRTVDQTGHIQVAFLAARSRVSPVRQQSIPRLELCVAHTGAQLAAVLKKELTLNITCITYWTDCTTFLNWLKSPSCRCGPSFLRQHESSWPKWPDIPTLEDPAEVHVILLWTSICDR